MLAASKVMQLDRLPTNNQGHIIMKNRVHAASRFIAGAFRSGHGRAVRCLGR